MFLLLLQVDHRLVDHVTCSLHLYYFRYCSLRVEYSGVILVSSEVLRVRTSISNDDFVKTSEKVQNKRKGT